jgi:MFS family permease
MDRFGRRAGIFIGAIIAIIGLILEGTSAYRSSLSQFLAGRFFLGMGTNISLAAGPTYVVEISHPGYRGILTALQASTLNLGGFIGALATARSVNYVGNKSWLVPVWIQIILLV